MFKVSNYYEQSRELPAENSFQIALLQWTDAATFFREASKMVTIIGLVSSTAGVVFNFNPTMTLTWTAVSGVAWVLFSTCANKLEPEAKDMIEHFKSIPAERGRARGMISYGPIENTN